MPNVKVSEDFKCAPDGHTVKEFKAGEIIDGEAAEMAIRLGKGKPTKQKPGSVDQDSKKKDKKPRDRKPEKTKPGRGPQSYS
jgi:hypothetical protein